MEVPATHPRGPELGGRITLELGGAWGVLGWECLSVGPASTACQARSRQGPW